MPRTIDELISETNNLITFPAVVSQFNDAVNSEESTLENLGAILQLDPFLTAKLLQLANSAYYGTSVPAETAKDAIFRLGVKQTQDLVFSISAKSAFDKISNDLVTNEDFWKHSLLCAVSAQSIAKKIKMHSADTLFTAGLLHDIGDLVLFKLEPEKSTEALELNMDLYDGLDQSTAELSVFNFDHAELGSRLAAHWSLPEVLKICIAHHHAPNEELEFAQHVAVINVANTIASLIEVNSHDLMQGAPIDDSTWKLLDTNAMIVESCINEVQDEYDDMARILFS